MKLYKEASVFDNDQMADDITDASTKAKSYMSFKSGYGLMIADLTGEEVAPDEVETGTRNLLISPTEVMIRNGQINIARFGSSIYLDEEGGGVHIGKIAEGYYNTKIIAEGMQVYKYETQIANFGSSIWLGNASNFSVDLDGKLNAKSATISGVLTAGAGSSIGGWTAYATRLESDLTGSGGLRSGMQNSATYAASSAVFYAGCNTPAGGAIANLSNTRFYVTQAGNLYAREAWVGDTSKICSEITESGIHIHYGSSNSWGAGLYVEQGINSGTTYGMLGLGNYNSIIVRGGSSSNSDARGNLQITCGSKPFNITATNATLKVNEIHVGGNKPFAFRLVAKTNQTVSANSGIILNFDADTPGGYTLLGAVSVYTNHQYACKLGAVHTSVANDQIRVGLSNTSASAITDLEVSVRIIYAKSGIFETLS